MSFNLLQTLVTNALEAVEIKLIRHRDDVDDDSRIFHPTYAHQIFGENEMVFGYKDLKVRLYYTAGSLQMFLGVKYSCRIDDYQKCGIKADDVTAKISDLLTSGVFYTNIDEFLVKLEKDEAFQPIGEKIDSCEILDGTGKLRKFEFFKCDISTPNFVQFHTRLQTFLMWFVDAASYIDIDDSQWMFYICYEKYTNSEGKTLYATVGYTTIYLYYAYPAHIRPRISQMLVLPPFQRLGIAAKFIQIIYNHFKNDPKVRDITVEDPSDEFRRVRNFVDVNLCKNLSAFAPDKLRQGFSQEMIKETRDTYKINARQSRTIYEILRLHHTNIHNEDEYKKYRLDVKKRLNLGYIKQREHMKKLERVGRDTEWMQAGMATPEERIEQLKVEYKEVEDEYRQILKRVED